jgi:hypothetical protein
MRCLINLVEAAGRKSPMQHLKIKKEIVAFVVKSPLYFSIPLQRRLQFIKFFSQQPVFTAIVDPQLRQATRKDGLKQPARALVKFPVVSIGVRSLVPYYQKISRQSLSK